MNNLTASQRKVIRDRLKCHLEQLYILIHSGYVNKQKLKGLEEEVDDTLKALSYL